MAEYYFLASLLPQLQIGHVPTLGYGDLKPLLESNLTKKDLEITKEFLHVIDYDNLRSIWMGEPIDERGNFNQEELEKALLENEWPDGKDFPEYLSDFLRKYSEDYERVQYFFRLASDFLDDQIESHEGFLRDLYVFEKQWRLVMVGFRAKKLGRDLSNELQYEDPSDPIVAQIQAQKDAKGFEPPFEYQELRPILEEYGDNPLELHKAFLEYRFRHMVELCGSAIFSIDRILGYMARLLLVEKWMELDMKKGIGIVDDIVREVK